MKFGLPFKPMLLSEVDKIFDDEDYLYELKFDGYRATIHVGKNKFVIYSRNGLDITYLYPELMSIQKLVKKDMIFDGEIVAFSNGISDFSLLQKRSHSKDNVKIQYFKENFPVCFIAFDCLYCGKYLTNETLLSRKKVLDTIDDNEYFIKVKYILKQGSDLFKKVKQKNLEGVVAKKIDSNYEINTRSKNWIKIKNLKDGKFYIGGYKEERSKNTIILYLGEYKKDKFYFVGKVLLGVKNKLYEKIMVVKRLDKSSFYQFDEKDVIYVEPRLTCEITYLARTKKGLRHPVFKR